MSGNSPLPSPRRRVAIYTRARDDEGLRRQREDVERHIAQRPDWTTVAVYEEVAQPDKKRPGSEPPPGRCEEWRRRPRRRARHNATGTQHAGLADIARVLDNCGVGIVTAFDEMDTQTPQGRLFLVVLTGFVDSFRSARRVHSRGSR